MQAQTNYSQAKYGYLNDIIALRLAAGNLDPTTIKQINGWLVAPPPPVPEGATDLHTGTRSGSTARQSCGQSGGCAGPDGHAARQSGR